MPLSLKYCIVRMMKVLKDKQEFGFVTFTKKSLSMYLGTYCFTAAVRFSTAGLVSGRSPNNKV